MSNQINIKSRKNSKLLELLLKGVDKKYNHTLYLASCYFSPDSAIKLISDVSRLVKLKNVILYIDRKTALAIGKIELQRVCDKFHELNVQLYAVDTATLFHTKAYALISNNKDGSIYRGSLIIGSSNLTGSGLTASNGNIESLLDTQDVELALEFLTGISKLKLLNIEQIDDFKSEDSLAFKYALLLEGSFVHKWLDDLGQYLSVKYQLNNYGKSRIGDDIFKSAGFNIDAATISKRYFKFDYKPPHLENTENLVRNFGIETYLGHWVSNSALETLFEKNTFDEFCSYLKKEISLQLATMKEAIEKDVNYLYAMGIIDSLESSPLELFQIKINSLLDNRAPRIT